MLVKGKIYGIQQKDTERTVYVGSTCLSLPARWSNHKQSVYAFPERKIYQFILQNGGLENYKMILIEEVEVENRKDLLKREGHYIKALSPIGNKYIAGMSHEERAKAYYERNKDSIKEYQKIYQKKYREQNRERINEKKRMTYRQKRDESREVQPKGEEICSDL
jgi:hypothetical protein